MGTYVLSWTSYGGVFCPSSADTVVIDVVPAANAGADQEYCELTTAVDLTGNINSIGTWTQVGNTPNVATVTATSGNTATASGLVPGIYTFQYEISDGTCTSTDVVTVTLFPPPPIANAGNDADYCDASSFVLTGNNPQASNGEWTLLYGPSGGNFVYSNDSVVEFTPTESNKYGVYIFTWKLSNGDCRNEDQVRITNYEPAAGNAGADISVACKSSVFLDALLEIGNGLWSFVSVSGDAPVPTIVSPILPNTEITGLGSQSSGDPAVYQFQYTISNGPDCDTVRDTVFVTVYEAPTEAFAGDDVTLCSQSTYNLEATPTTVGSGKWIHVNGPNIPVIADSSAYNSPVSGLIAGTYVFYWETTTEFCSSVDSFVLVNYDEPSAPDDLADFEICQFEELILSNSIPVSGTGKWSQTSGPAANILSPASASTQVVGIIPGSTYTFRWIVSNGVCTPLYDDVTVTVHEQVTMAEAGANQAFCNQTSAVLNGNNPLIGTGTWTVEDGPNVPTFTNANLPNTPVTGLVAGTYTLRWTIDNGTCSSYDEMLITVYPDLTVSSLTDGNVCVGGAFNLSVSANGGTGAYTYQWQDSIAGGNWQNVTAGSGATAAAYTTPSSLSSGTHYYRVLVSDCNTVISNEAELVVNPDASIAVQPLGASICPGSTHAMNVTVVDGINVSYQWQRSTTGTGGWSNITGATTPSFTTPALNSTMFYRVRINDNGIGCADPTSNVAAVYVPYIRTQPAGAVICDGGTHTMSLAMENNGGLAYSYQWQQSSTSGGAWSDISGATSASYTTTNLTTGNYYYQCVITPTTPGCSPLTSSEVQVAVVPDPQITAESGDVSICEGGAVTHSVSVSGGTASSYSYQWQRSSVDCSSGFSNIAGATSANYTTPQLNTAGSYYYRCVITQPESGCQFISSCKTITVVEDPQVDTQPVGTTICSGSTHSMNVVASGGTGIFSYQWQDSIPGGNWTDISGAVADAYTTAALTTKTYFRVIISQNGVGCDELYSEVAEVAVPEISSQPTGGFVCEETPNTLSISVDAGSATLHYQWQSSDFDCNSGWFDIAGANNASYSADNLPESGTRYFRCVVSVTAPDCTPLISDCVALVKTGCTPLIGVAKQLVNTIYNEDGTADVLFNIRVQNYGNVVLDNIQVEEDLTTAFNNNFEILELASTSFDVNTSFNGNSDKNLLNNSGTTNMLGMGASTDIRLKVRVLATGSYTNQVTASSPSSGGVSDTSQNGSDPDPDGDGDPTNNSEGTPVEIGSCTLTANVTQHSTCGNAAGSVTLTGSEAGTITLNGVKQVSPATFPGLQAGWYNASFKAVSGCIATVSFEITNSNSDLAVSVTHHKDVSCNGGNDGEIEVSATDGSGTYSYYLVDGGNIVSTIANTTGSFSTSNLVMGEYSVRVEDSNGCTYTVSFDIEEPTRLVAEISNYEDVSCNGATDGAATVNAAGGTTPYSYLWSNGQTTAVATGLVAGNYTVTVTDANNCTTTTSVAIGQPASALFVSTDQVENPTCNGETDGSISITVSGGTAPYSYSWSNGYNAQDPAGLAAGTYTVIVTDANGCTATESYTLTEPAALSLGYSNIVNTSCNAAVGAVTLTGSEAGTVVLNGVSLASPATFTGLAAGYYTAYFENAVGCSTEVSFNIINTNSNLVATLDIADPLCVGETVTATVTASGGTAPYSYTLNGTTTNATGVFDNLGAGDYNVLVTDNNGCTYYIAFDIDEPTQLVAEIISSIDVSCNGATDGAATVNAAGGTTPYSYLWSNGQTTAMATGMGAGTYSVTVTDANNCTTTTSVAIGQPASALFVSTDQVENPTCNGETDGSISITVSGGTASYSYSWSNGYNAQDPAGLAAGTYTVIVTDANGCTATESYTLTEPAALSLGYSNIVNTSCNAAVGAVTLTGSEAGTVVLNGVSLASPATFTGLAAGYYTAYFENAVGCSTEVSFNIINTNSDLVATLDIADPLCVGETVTATVTANGGTAPYSYTLNRTTTNATGVFDNLGAGDYNVLVTDNNGCTYYIAFDIDEPTQLVAEIISSIDVSCNGATDGAATVNAAGGTTPYSYLWSNGQTTAMATGLVAGNYTVTVTDANNCTTTTSVAIGQPVTALVVSTDQVENPTCNGETDGSIGITVSGGTAPYSYSWSNGYNAQDPAGLAAGTYTVIVTDANGCTATESYTLTEPAALSLGYSNIVNTSCNAAVGAVTLTGSEAGTVVLNGVSLASPATFTGLAAGYYTAYFENAVGCSTEVSFNIINTNSDLVATLDIADPLCVGETVTATVTASGGTAPYSYTLNGTTTNATGVFDNLGAGDYNVLVTDNNGCTYYIAFDIDEPTQLVAEISNYEDVSCNGATDGAATVNAAGGTTPYSYLWSNGQTTAMATGMGAGTYTVTVTDANGCTTTTSVAIGQPATALVVSTDQVENPTCNGETDGSISITVSGGTAPYSYSWSNGYNSEDPAGLAAGTYTVIVTDANGCTATESYTLTEPAALSLGYSNIVNTSCNAAVGAVTLTGSEAGTVVLNGVSLASPATFTGLAAGYYTAYFENAVGCSTEVSFNIINTNSDLVATLDIADPLCVGETVTATVTASGGTAPYSYTLNGTTTNATGVFDNLGAGDYNVLVTDNNGCTYYIAFDIDEPTQLVAEIISSIDVSCNGATDGAATVNAAGGTTPYSYLWSNGQTTAMATGMGAGTYLVTVTDANGCSTVASVTITENTCAPLAVDDNVISPEDTPASGNVLDNDSDANGLPLTVTEFVVGGTTYTAGNTANIPGVGTLVIRTDGTYTFTPEQNYNGSVPAATYTVSNGTEGDTADLSIFITPVNDVPVAVADAYSTSEDTPVSGNLASNDIRSGDGGNTWMVDTNPGNGSVTINPDGTFTYTPDTDFSGTDSFTYKLCDVDGDCVSETVEITVSPVNDNPVAVDDYIATNEDTPVNIPLVDNDNFGGDGPSTSVITIVSPPSNGQAVVNNNGTPNDPTDDFVEYTPNPDFNGSDNFVYEICDANGDCDQGNVIVNVNPVGDSPLAVEDAETMDEDGILYGNVSTNDTRSGDGGNIWTVVTNPSHGTVIMNPDGSYIYTPEENYNGPDSFTYQLCDVDGSCSSATVEIEVGPLNDPPVIADVPKTGPEDEDITFDISDFTSAFSDVDGDELTKIEIVTLPENGTLYLDGVPVNPGDNIDAADISLLTFTPDEDWNGTTTFDWNGYDANSKALIDEQVIITITPVNDPPVAGIAEIPGQQNPGGTNTVKLPASGFSGTDKDGDIDFILLAEIPAGATSITVDGTIYTTIPAEGIKIPATDGGQPLFDVEVDPADGVSEVVLEYFVIDNEGLISESPGSVTIPFTDLSVSGTVFNDTNGLADHTVNGTGSNFGGALYMNLVNDLNQVIASIPVGADGTYSFTESDGLEQGKNYKLIISGSQQNTGATLSSASYPEGYTSSGENIGSGIGNDGKTDGVLSINTNAGSLSEANFGILGEMTVDAGSDAEMCSTEGSILLSGAQAVNYTSLRWTSDGTGTFDDATAPNPEYFPSVADISDGQVRLTLIVNGLGSVAQMVDAMTLTIWPGAKVYAGPDFEVCANLPVIITGATAADYGTITWSSTGGTFDNIHALNPTFTPLASGNIELVLTASGLGSCSNVSDTVVIAVSEAMVLSAPEITNANCDSREDGGVRLGVGSGGVEPFIYELSTGESNSTGQFEGLAAGGYIYWVTDANGCKVSGSFKVDDPNELELTVTAENDVTCYGGSNGSACLEASGGTGPYTFGWSGGIIPADPTANPQVVSGLPAGFYVVTVTDANGCVEIESLEIEEPDSLSIILVDQINPDCNNAGQVMVSGSGGVPPYSYSATSGTVSGNTISGLSSGDVTVTITDSNGCTNFLTVTLTDNDESAPVVSCPAPIQTTNTIGLCFAEIELELPVYTDNCDTEPTVRYMVYGPDNSIKGPFSAANNTFEFSSGISQVQWMVTDASGNETSCMQEVTVRESEDPEISCTGQDEYVFYSTPGLCGYRIPDTSLDVSAMDNCQLLSVSHNFGGWGVANSLEGAVFPVGSTEVIWTATDYAGNSVSCNFTVTVIDTEEPSFVNCPDGATFTVGLFAGACQGGAIWSIPVASDACSDVTVSQTSGPEVGSILEAGTYVIEYEATDDAGNSITCSFNLVVTDTEGPVIVCLPDIEKTSDSGTCTWKSPEGSLSPLLANSNCPATVNWRVSNPDGTTATGIDDVSGYTFQPGTSTVYYAISENTSGQDWDCSFSVTIVDREKPVIDCPEAMTVTALPGECEAEVALTVPAFSDNCSSSPADISYVVYAPDNSMSEVMNSADLSYTFMAGINRIEWRVTDAAGNSAVCWQSVWVNTDRNSLVPEAGGNAAICENDSFQVVNALAPDFATIEWTTSGTGHFVDNTLENPVYVPSETDILDGFVILTITASSSCESASDNLVLSIAKAPVVFAGNDASICENDTYQLNGRIQNRTLAVEWETLGTGTFSNAAIFNPVYTPGAEDVAAGKVTLVFRGISAGTCENGVDSLTLNIQRQAEVFAGEDAWICEGSSFELSGATLKNGGPVIWSTNGTGTFDAKNVLNTVYTPSRGDILNGRVVLTVAYESEGACSSVSDEMILNISRHPEVDAGSDVSTCFGLPVTLSMASAVNAETIQWFTNGNGMLEGANSLTPRYIPAEGESGEIILTLVATGNGACETDTVTDEVILIIYNELVIDAGADDTIFYRSSAILDVDVENGSGAYFYTWKPAETVLNDKAAYTETVKLTETTKFSVTVTDASSGCVAEVSKTVVVDSDSENLITIFNAFTPNGDGVNDTWQIEGIEKFPENEVMFFNRWGDKVKEFQNYDNVSVVWDGTNNRDKKLPDGTYYYIVTLKNVETYTGWVHIRSGN